MRNEIFFAISFAGVALLIALLFFLFKKNRLEVIAYMFILLFLYTAMSKLFLYPIYLSDLHRSPSLGHYALPISILVPLTEIITSVLLFLPATRRLGFYAAFTLMTLFTIYVAWVLGFTNERPCTCGGVIRELSWRGHLVLNTTFMFFGLYGIIKSRQEVTERPLKSSSVSMG